MSGIDIKKYGKVLGKGVFSTLAPSILKGVLVELFRIRKVNVKQATEWVLANYSLWDSLEPERKIQFKQLAGKLGDVSWMTVAWAIDALKDDFPAVASLFLGWKKGNNWLARQIEEIKKELQV
ncbi:hypothetical protein LCGC14_0655010 [marine sediment metagenome]|uniref:Uncharacterized protein n=1 Tax=marine sediment metagenome TaxID=412755 RepID=A0A0F9R0G7_9ZZZZ